MSFEEILDGRMDRRTDRRADDGQISIIIAHLEHFVLR